MTDHTKEGLILVQYDCDELGVVLDCWFEYEAAERGAREFGTGLQLEPDYPATWALYHVYLPGSNVDICPALDEGLRERIEVYAEEQSQENAEDDAWNDGYEDYVDWRDAR